MVGHGWALVATFIFLKTRECKFYRGILGLFVLFLFVLLILTKLRFKGFSLILNPRTLLTAVLFTFRLSADGPKLNMTPRRPKRRLKCGRKGSSVRRRGKVTCRLNILSYFNVYNIKIHSRLGFTTPGGSLRSTSLSCGRTRRCETRYATRNRTGEYYLF